MTSLYIIAAVAVIMLVALMSQSNKKNTKLNGKPSNQKNKPQDYTYQKKQYLLTKNEYEFYKQLLPIAISRNYTVCPKVRLADIIEPQKGQNWKGAFARIQSKHIDFLLCQGTMVPVLAIELDDNSHNTDGRAERDSFVDAALSSARIPILRTKGPGNLRERISEVLDRPVVGAK